MGKEKNRNKNIRSEFRTSDKAKGHMSYVFRKEADQLKFLSMTHNPPDDKRDKYKQLTHSVDPKDKRDAYINTEVDSDHYLNFGPKKKDFYFKEEDKKVVKRIIKKNKKSEK